MKYKQHLRESIAPEYGPDPYLDYPRLDDIIRVLSRKTLSSVDETNRVVSLTTPSQTDAMGKVVTENLNEEKFFKVLDGEIAKVEEFTLKQVNVLREKLDNCEAAVESAINNDDDNELDLVAKMADSVSKDFLHLEKYVNINFMGFHKILKKHDKHLPSNPCKSLYVSRMHNQAWVRGDFSDLVVRLSDVYRRLRDDVIHDEKDAAAGSFLRSTNKYWVKTEDVSAVKYTILKHLPVFLQKTATGDTDSQLTNSVYLDNENLELYQGRLDKTPGALALRFRWYGANEPKIVFIERKTHRDKWTGEVSVKERFIVDETEVFQLFDGTYPVEDKRKKLEEKGKTKEELDEWELLVRQILQVIQTKQLVPTVRTQCMRTAFQIPFDDTVRISLDTNLCMISERGYNIQGGHVWHRDPNKKLTNTEITRFPHAVLEIKLNLGATGECPAWVEELQSSGLIYEVHKFSKFIHGCAALLPDEVRSVPYWVDDASIRQSLIETGAEHILVDLVEGERTAGPGANIIFSHLLPFGTLDEGIASTAAGRTKQHIPHATTGSDFFTPGASQLSGDDDEFDDGCGAFWCPQTAPVGYAPTSIQKLEPKSFFANERTAIHWLHQAVVLSSIAAGILAFAGEDGNTFPHYYAFALMAISLGFCLLAIHTFLVRMEKIKSRSPTRWDDPRGPIIMGGALTCVLVFSFCIKIIHVSVKS